ncbi:MAG: hypothetical protein IJ773_10890, partial [Lachnospiraceae bacterium]|nr:hypothetical protein [Lachnospiraceae bacterium]
PRVAGSIPALGTSYRGFHENRSLGSGDLSPLLFIFGSFFVALRSCFCIEYIKRLIAVSLFSCQNSQIIEKAKKPFYK